MRRFVLTFFSVICFLFILSPVFAVDPPIQTSPADSSTVTTTTMKWEIPAYSLYSGDHFRVQVDDDQAFTSTIRDYKTDNSSYTPSGLDLGTWYWRVEAKNSSGDWSDWSSIWSFILASPTPTPIPADTPTPTPSPSNTPTPTQTPVPTKTPTPTKKLTVTPTKAPSKSPTPTSSESSKVNLPQSILGTSVAPTAEPSPTPIAKSNPFSFTNLIFIAGGIILILIGAFIFTFVAKDRFKKI